MSYIGNQPTTVAFLTDQFSGTGSQTAFTLSAAPANTASIIVAVSGVLQDPSTYSVSGTTLTFSAAPPAGTGNISVRFLGIPASGVTSTAYRTQTEFTATAGQTTFSVPSYTVGYIDVYRNGALLGSADFTATNGTTVVLANPASSGDLVETISFFVSSVLNAIPATAGAVTNSYLLDGSITKAKMGSGSTWAPVGTVVQVVSTHFTSSFSTTSTSLVDITNFNVVITPTATSSKILVIVNINHANESTGGFSNGFCVLRNGTAVGNGTLGTGSSPNFMIVNAPYAGNSAGVAVGQFLDSPSSTSALTYKVQTQCQSGTGTVWINRTGNLNGGTRPDQGGFSSCITVMEIAA